VSWLRLAQIFGVALVALVVGLAPLQLALGAMGADRRGLAAQVVSGTIWGGELKTARFGGVELGDLRLGLDVAGLLLGGGRIWFQAHGPVSARGVAMLTGSRFGASGLDATLPLEAVMLRAPVRGRLGLKGVQMEFRHGACHTAQGRITLDRLSLPGGAQLPASLVLSGAPTCRQGAMVAPLSGQAEGVGIDLLLTIDGAGGYRLETLLQATNPGFESMAVLTGFERTMEGFRRVDQGRLGGDAPR
jgi:hypothetical protein